MSNGFLGFIYTQLCVSLPKPKASCTGQTVLVTGSNTGIGKEAARHFVKLGASTVILAVRSLEKGEAAKKDIERTTKCGKDVVQVWKLDMSSYQSVQEFAARVSKELPRLDIALLNAGIAQPNFKLVEKDESNVTINVVSTFFLALLLLPKLKETSRKYNVRPNLTIVGSEVHAWAKFEERHAPEGGIFERLAEDPGKPMDDRYMTTKLLDVLGTRAMADRKSASQIPVTINVVNPGLCKSELSRDLGFGMAVLNFLLARTSEQGSRNLVHAATSGAETHGQYISDCKVEPPSPWVLSREGYEVQNRVWEELIKKLEDIHSDIAQNL